MTRDLKEISSLLLWGMHSLSLGILQQISLRSSDAIPGEVRKVSLPRTDTINLCVRETTQKAAW